MKNKWKCSSFLLVTFFIQSSVIFVHAQKSSNLKEVEVYFYFIGAEGIEDEILPLKRNVSATAPLRSAIEEMLKDPTEDEKKLGYESLNYDNLKLVSVKLKRGTARMDFSRVVGENTNPGDLLTLKFEAAVKKTAKQFPAVKKVVVCVNGMNEFGIGMVLDAPEPCPKEK